MQYNKLIDVLFRSDTDNIRLQWFRYSRLHALRRGGFKNLFRLHADCMKEKKCFSGSMQTA